MKNTNLFLTLVALIVLTANVFASDKDKTNAYKVDGSKSKLTWVGKKVTGEHSGNINVSSGTLNYDGKALKGGSFEIDMNSITCTDLTDPGYNGKLVGHLKNDDFFATDKHQKANFVITKVKSTGKDTYDVTGNLTIKGITQPVTFPATVKSEGNQITSSAKITVDRTKYDIKYGSGSFFDNLGDKAIDNNFILDVNLVAVK